MFKFFGCLIIGFFLTITSINSCAAEINNSEVAPAFLYKVLTVKNWNDSQEKEEVVLSIDDKEFIHLATDEQYQSVADNYFASASEYVLLKIDAKDVKGRLVLENNPGGSTKYYHLYEGSIPLSAVKEYTLIKK